MRVKYLGFGIPISVLPLSPFGFKLHVSATPESAKKIAAAAVHTLFIISRCMF